MEKKSQSYTKKSAKGVFFMMQAAILFAMLAFLIKLLSLEYRVWDIALYRFLGGFVVLWAIFGRRENFFKPKNPGLFLIRGATGTIGFILLVIAIKLIPLSTAIVYFFSFPAFSAFFSGILFKDRISVSGLLCVCAGIIGVMILFDPEFGGPIIGQVCGAFSGFFTGLTVSIIKKLRETQSSAIVYFYFCFVGLFVVIGPYLACPGIPKNITEWFIVGGIIVTSTGGQLLMNMGFRFCKSWEGGLYLTSELIFSTLLGVFIFGDLLGIRFLIGGFFILVSAIAVNYLTYSK